MLYEMWWHNRGQDDLLLASDGHLNVFRIKKQTTPFSDDLFQRINIAAHQNIQMFGDFFN